MRWVAWVLVAWCGCASAAEPTLSPSIEADADYLLTTTDFRDAQYGMAITGLRSEAGRIVVRTTGAEFTFDTTAGTLAVRQLLARARQVVRVTFPAGALAGLKAERLGSGAVSLTGAAGGLRLRVNADSLLMLRTERAMELRCELAFQPASARAIVGDRLLLDEWGYVGTYFATGEGHTVDLPGDRGHTSALQAGQIWWLAVGPPRPYPWTQSLRERVAWHWSSENAYPADDAIRAWSQYANILLQQAEVMLWKDWSLRFVPRLGVGEFERVNATCARLGMRNIVYTSPLYFLAGTDLESKAMNSFDHFAETGFSPGDPRGMNWPIFVAEIGRVMREYKPAGLYFDGIYGSVVRSYLVSRKAREIVGDKGLLEFHGTGSPPGGGVYLPQMDTYYDYVLRGEGTEAQYSDPDYLRYFVSTHNISNAIGVLCNNNQYPLTESFVGTLLDNNIRLHFLPAADDDQRLAGMKKYYWPALTPELEARVAARQAPRQAAFEAERREYARVLADDQPGLTALWREDFADPALAVRLPDPSPPKGLETALPGGWRAYLSPRGAGSLRGGDKVLRIAANRHTVAWIERDLPPEATAVTCRLRMTSDSGMSWGPAMALWAGTSSARLGLRSDNRLQTDRPGEQVLYDGYPAGEWVWLRLRLAGHYVVSESSRDGITWRRLRIDRLSGETQPRRLMVGKVPFDAGRTDHTEPGDLGLCEFADVVVYRGR